MKYLLGFFILLNVIVCSAAIYQQMDQSNNIIYSDTPLSPNAIKINAPAVPRVSSPQAETTTQLIANPSAPATEKPRVPYTTFLIISPFDQQTIQNQVSIPVELQVNPDIQENDKIQLYLDNKPWGNPQKSKHFDLTEVERGTHQVSAKLLNGQGTVVQDSNSVTIFVHRASVNSINANQNRPAS